MSWKKFPSEITRSQRILKKKVPKFSLWSLHDVYYSCPFSLSDYPRNRFARLRLRNRKHRSTLAPFQIAFTLFSHSLSVAVNREFPTFSLCSLTRGSPPPPPTVRVLQLYRVQKSTRQFIFAPSGMISFLPFDDCHEAFFVYEFWWIFPYSKLI